MTQKACILGTDRTPELYRRRRLFLGDRIPRLSILCAVLFSLVFLLSAQKDSWTGSLFKKDNVIFVNNPEQPVFKGDVVKFTEELRIPDTDGQHYILVRPRDILVNEDADIFVSDQRETNIKVFNRNGRFLRIIGRKGMGPGEFEALSSLFFLGKDLAVFDWINHRITLFSPQGEYRRSISTAALNIIEIQTDVKGNLFALVSYIASGKRIYEIHRLDKDLNDKGRFVKVSLPYRETFSFFKASPSFWASPDGRVLFGFPDKTYEFSLYGNDGSEEKRIQKKHAHETIPEVEIAPFREKIPQELDWHIPRGYSPYYKIAGIINDNIIILRRYYFVEKRYLFDVFDPDGKYMAAFTLYNLQRGALFVQRDRFYTIEENEDGLPIIKRYKVTWPF